MPAAIPGTGCGKVLPGASHKPRCGFRSQSSRVACATKPRGREAGARKRGAKGSGITGAGDNDTRVEPLHARKMTALLQAASTSGRPILLHYSLSGGHWAGVGVEQQIEDDADQLSFLWTETGQSVSRK